MPVSEWPNTVRRDASELQNRILAGVGGEWQQDEIGESAVHRRRRLSEAEMVALYQVRPTCPVFTHGEALKAVLGAGAGR